MTEGGWGGEREQGKEGGRELGKGGSPSHPLAWLGQRQLRARAGEQLVASSRRGAESSEGEAAERQRGQWHCPAGPLARPGPARPAEARATH
jgi:hypothetical protein